MEQKFNNLINTIKNEKMTEEEKTSIRFKVQTFIQNNPVTIPIKTPYFSRFHFAHAGRIFATGLLLMVIGTGGLSYSSASALPGDLLYPVKINFNEKIEEKFASTPEQKIALRQKRIETRFSEVETLINNKKITPENNSVVMEAEKQINQEKEKLVNTLTEVQKTNPEKVSLEKNKTENSIKNHREKINTLMNKRKEENTKIENTPIKIKRIDEKQIKETPELIKTTEENKNTEENKKEETLLIKDVEIISDTIGDSSSIPSDEINSSAANSEQNN